MSNDVIVIKHRSVATLSHGGIGDDVRVFFDVYDDDGASLDTLGLRRDVWEEMGKPDTVTISVEPGDHLNVDV